MFFHYLRFFSQRDFEQFSSEIGAWWKTLTTFHDGHVELDSGYYFTEYRSEHPIDKERQIDVQGAPWVVSASCNFFMANTLPELLASIQKIEEVVS